MEEIDRFEAETEAGKRYTIVLLAKIVPFRGLSGQETKHRGGTQYELVDGGHVNQLDRDTFQIFDTDEIVRRVP